MRVPADSLTGYTLSLTRAELSAVFIYDVAVVESWQRRGVGRRVMGTLRTIAVDAGIGVVFVPADNEGSHALDFYRALGGTPTSATILTFGASQ